MLKFLRKYSKWMLAIFACFLMIGFLLPSTGLLKDDPDHSNTPVARLADGSVLTLADRRAAVADLAVLSALTQDNLLLSGSGARDEEAANRWMMIQAEAKHLGLDAGDNEVDRALMMVGFAKRDAEGKLSGGLDGAAMAAFATQHNTDEAGLRRALKGYLRAESVRQLASGAAHDLLPNTSGLATPGLQRLAIQQRVLEMSQQANMLQWQAQMAQTPAQKTEAEIDAMRAGMLAQRMMDVQNGAQRMSTPLLTHQLQNLTAHVSGQVVVLPAATPARLAQQSEPTEAQLKELFEPLKNSPRGSAPYGFGYRLPPRFKIEALVIPVAQAKRAAEAAISEAQVRDYFDEHAADFAEKPGETPVLSAENREKARQQLLLEETGKQALAFAASAERVLDADKRTAAAHNGALAAPTPLKAAAQAVFAKHGFMPEILSETQIQAAALAAWEQTVKQEPLPTVGAADGWMTPGEFGNHPLLGHAMLVEQSKVPLQLAVNHMAGGEERQALPINLELAVNLRLPTARTADGSLIVARVTGADAPRAAASQEEVKALLVRDARELAAFRMLASHTDQLCANAVKDAGLNKFASAANPVSDVPTLTRLNANNPSATPKVPGVEDSGELVKAVFERAETLRATSAGVKGADLKERLIAVPLEHQRAVALFQLNDYAPTPKSSYVESAKEPLSRIAVDAATTGRLAQDADPLSEANLKQRLGWTAK